MRPAASATLAALALCLLNASPVSAAFGISAFDGRNAAGPGGGAFTQAGGHPYVAETTIAFNQTTDAKGNPLPDEAVRNLRFVLPLGFIANPQATPTRCTEVELMTGLLSATGLCPDSSQVGTVNLVMPPGFGTFTVPLYNMVPSADEPAQLGFRFLVTDAHVDTRVAFLAGAYRVIAELHDVSNAVPLLGATLALWGVPADSGHDALRGNCTETTAADLCPVDAPPVPFVRMPTACVASGPSLETSVHAESWPGSSADAAFFSHLPPGLPSPGPQQGPTGCAAVPFNPSISLQPTSHAADSPTGLHVDLSVPQAGLESPVGIAASDLQGAVVELPAGMSINPAAADGLGACAPAQIGFGEDGEVGCPDSAKIGSLEIQTPLLEAPIGGSVYLATPKDNLFGSLLAIYLVAKGPGFVIKLPGRVEAKPDGQLLVGFDDDPQLPFSTLSLDLFGGPRAPLRTPSACGSYATNATLTPWSGTPPVHLSNSFAVTTGPGGGPCPPGAFVPRLSAGTANPLAGRFSPFALRLIREDGEQELQSLRVVLPQGLLAKLAGVPYCPDSVLASIPAAEGTGGAQLASPSCPPASQIGTVVGGAGAGTDPLYLETGRLYLAGPYKGAPLSVAAVVPALAGPFDLGNVVVRAALEVDPLTAQVGVASDPIPTVIDGIPLDLRDLRVALSRPEFTLNPTSCAPMAFAGSATSARGLTAPLRERFQVGSCAELPFSPRLSLRLSGGTDRGAHPRFRAVLMGRGGDAGIARASLALPHSEFLDQAHIKTICTRVQFAADACPTASVYGFARAFSPLLDQPLSGPVYLRSSSHALPDLVAHLQGQVTIDLVGRIDSYRGGIRATFGSLPDAPVSRFVLEMAGGRRGLLVNSTNLCARAHRATAKLDAQNGRVSDSSPFVTSDCRKAQF